MIYRLSHIYILPLKYIPSFIKYLILKIFGKNLRNTYLEWVNSLQVSLLYSNSIYIGENKDVITSFCKENNYNIECRKYPSSDIWVYNHIFGYEKEYKYVCDLYNEYFKKKEKILIVDAGANVGYASLYFANEFKDSKIVAIEPESSNYNMIHRNIEINNLETRIFPIKKALWYNNTFLQLFTEDKNNWGFCVDDVKENNSNNTIETITFNDILKSQNADFVNIFKIDIECAEFQIFLDVERCEDILTKTELVAIEIHERADKYNKILENFKAYGFKHFESGELSIFINENKTK